jgi:hypothetical protein
MIQNSVVLMQEDYDPNLMLMLSVTASLELGARRA